MWKDAKERIVMVCGYNSSQVRYRGCNDELSVVDCEQEKKNPSVNPFPFVCLLQNFD